MEETPISPVEPVQDSESPNFFKRATSGKSFLIIFVILGVLALGSGFFAYNAVKNGDGGEKSSDEVVQQSFISDNAFVYGYWVGEEAIIALHNLQNGGTGVLATLPTNVKHIKITSPTTMLYIADTNERDHGKEIVQRDLATGQEISIFKADEGFGIDDYAVSSNGQYMSVWEVQMPEDSATLTDGKSRVYNYDLGTQTQYLIYDEVFGPAVPVHYPIGITDGGKLFADKFLANSGAGWAYGMSTSNLDGSQKSDISSMRNGTYSSQPVMSLDGSYIAFAGYSGPNGALEEKGFRKALTDPNTVELLDTTSQDRIVVRSQAPGIQYPSVLWDKSAPKLLITETDLSASEYSFNQFSYAPDGALENSIISISDSQPNNGIAYATLSGDQFLVGKRETNEAFMGNLGEKYSRSFRSFTALKKPTNTYTDITLSTSPVQMIAVVGSAYFPNSVQTAALQRSKNQLQLGTFVIKQELAPKREFQQSIPIADDPAPIPEIGAPPPVDLPPQQCVDGQEYQTAQQCYGTSCGDVLLGNCNGNTACEENAKENYIASDGSCTDSPLYLYGEVGQKVSVQVGVPLYSPNIPYSPLSGVEAEIASNGNFYANGKLISGFSFDYAPALKKILRPEYGEIVTRENLEATLESYAKKLGLNAQETKDLLQEVQLMRSRYQYVSFYDDTTSKKILPLYFSPTPDTYRNIVFYVEEFMSRPDFKSEKPEFDPIIRRGLTAVEISILKR